jgi:hypothetical protein
MYQLSKILIPLMLCVTGIATLSVSVNAQQAVTRTSETPPDVTSRSQTTDGSLPARRGSPRTRRRGRASGGNLRSRGAAATNRAAAVPVAYVNQPAEPEYLFGQAQVTVKGNQDPIIRLGLAQHGPAVIEFPASDNFFAVHPGGSQLVTYDNSPTLGSDHFLVFRAGKDFVVPPPDSRRPVEPLASVSVQMQSGMFVTFVFYPVRDLARMAHRCVVMYSREEVVAARRAAGLAVNLDGKDTTAPPTQSARVNAASIETAAGSPTPTPSPAAEMVLASGSTAGTGDAGGDKERSKKREKLQRTRSKDMVKEAQRALQSSLSAPQKFTGWSASTHGLSVAALAPLEINDKLRLTVVAVRNTSSAGLCLVAGQPDLDIATVDDKSRPVQIQSITKLYMETSALGGAIPAGAVAYYAIVYEMPTLSASQRLRLSVAQVEAADAPASTALTSASSIETK